MYSWVSRGIINFCGVKLNVHGTLSSAEALLVSSNANALDGSSYLVMQIATLAMQCAGEAKRNTARIKLLSLLFSRY